MSRKTSVSRKALLVCALLGIVIVGATALQGPARFTGLRWVFDWTPPRRTMPPQQNTGLGESTPLPRPHAADISIDLPRILLWIAIGIVVVIAVILIWRWLSRRPSRSAAGLDDVDALTMPVEPVPLPEPEPEAPVLRRGVEQALLLLDADREPRDAVMRAWLGLQQTAEDSGIVRRSAETATEFTTRIMGHVAADDRAIRRLLSLYLRTRFGDHPITKSDVAGARESLEALARSWNADV